MPRSRPCSQETGVRQIVPVQYMDRWRLDHNGVQVLDNDAVKRKLGFH